MQRTSRTGSVSSFILVFFILTITFCLVSAGIFKVNTTIGMNAAYAKKSRESSGGSSGSDGGGSKGDDGGSGGGGSDNDVFYPSFIEYNE